MNLGKAVSAVLVCGWAVLACGCVSLDDYKRLEAAHRSLLGQKENLEGALYDSRSLNESFRTRFASLEDQVASKDALATNLQDENDRLAETARLAQQTLEEMAERYRPGDIAISGPKLPQELDSALKMFADAHPSAVTYYSEYGTVKWRGDLLFALGSDVVVESAMPALMDFARVIKSQAAQGFEVIVVGHTDTVPIGSETAKRHPTNWHLSTHRAISVGNVLSKNGYDSTRIGVMGCGEFRPIASNDTDQGRSLNRRVEIYLVPRGAVVAAGASSG